jgi:hypothetical protein
MKFVSIKLAKGGYVYVRKSLVAIINDFVQENVSPTVPKDMFKDVKSQVIIRLEGYNSYDKSPYRTKTYNSSETAYELYKKIEGQ